MSQSKEQPAHNPGTFFRDPKVRGTWPAPTCLAPASLSPYTQLHCLCPTRALLCPFGVHTVRDTQADKLTHPGHQAPTAPGMAEGHFGVAERAGARVALEGGGGSCRARPTPSRRRLRSLPPPARPRHATRLGPSCPAATIRMLQPRSLNRQPRRGWGVEREEGGSNPRLLRPIPARHNCPFLALGRPAPEPKELVPGPSFSTGHWPPVPGWG